MNNAGTALMGIGIGAGRTAAEDAAMAAISSPLLDSTIENAKGVVFNISGGPNLSLNEVNQAAKLIYSTVEADANVIFGALVDDTLEDNISITVLATGFTERGLEKEMITTASLDDFNDVKNWGLQSSAKGNGKRSQQQKQGAPAAAAPAPKQTREEPARAEPSKDDSDKIPGFLKKLKKRR